MNNYFNNKISDNDLQIRQCKAKIHELKLGDFGEKAGRVALMGTLYYLPILGVLFLLNVPGALLPLVTLGSTFGSAAITNGILEKKANCKKRFKEVSKSKNESERLEEIMRLEMEIERLECHNNILSSVSERIKKEEDLINNHIGKSKHYKLIDKRDNLNKNKLVKKIEELENELSVKLNELNCLVDESTLRDKKNITDDKLSTMFYSMIYTMPPLILSIMPVMSYTIRPLPAPSTLPLITTLGVGALTFGGSVAYLSKKNKDSKKAINRIDSERQVDNGLALQYDIDKTKARINNIYFAFNDYKKKLNNIELQESGINKQTKAIEYTHEFEDSLDDEYKLTLK